MDLPAEISFKNMDRSEAVEARVRERVDKLKRHFERIDFCRVVVEAPHRRHYKGKAYHVRVVVGVPGQDVVISRDPGNNNAHVDVYVAVRDAFDAAERRLEDFARRLRGDVKVHETPPHGQVARLFPDEGYGFVRTADGLDVYFHRNAVVGNGFDKLEVGAEVRLEIDEEEGEKGPQASTVHVIGKHRVLDQSVIKTV